MPNSYSSSSLLASVAASPSTPNTSSTNSGISTFRSSWRSLLPFGPTKNSNPNASSASSSATPPRSSFSSFGSIRKSIARERERKTSLTNLLPIISIDRSAPAADSLLPTRRSVSCSHLEQPMQSEFGEKETESPTAPVLRSISPGPPLSADLSTIIEADTSGISKNDVHPSPSTEASLDLSPNLIAKQVYDAITEKDQWLAAENPIVIDAEDTDDADGDEENEPTEVLPPQSKHPDNASINIENVDPSIVALLSPNSLPKSPSAQSPPPLDAEGVRRATPTSIPRLRPPMANQTTPRSSSSDTTFNASTPTGSSNRKMPSYTHTPLSSSSLAAAPEIQSTRITVTANTPEKSIIPRLFGAHQRSLTKLTRSHSAQSASSAPPTPSSRTTSSLAIPNRLQVYHPTSSSETHLGPSAARTPSPIHAVQTPHTHQPHSPHTPQTPHTPQLVSTQGSSASSTSTAPNTPGSPHSPSRIPSHSRIPTSASTASSISRENSESSSSAIAHRFRAYHPYETSASVGYGRASLDSTRPPPRIKSAATAPASAGTAEHHVLATSTPFRRSEDAVSDLGGTRRRRGREREEPLLSDSPSGIHNSSLSGSPSPNKTAVLLNSNKPQLRTRKRSMSVQEGLRAAQSLIAGRRSERAELLHHRMNAASRSHSSLSGRAMSARVYTKEGDDEDESLGSSPTLSHPPPLHNQRPPLHDWLGPRSVKALRAAGLLDDREREPREDHQLVLAGRNSRERSGSVATSVMSGRSSSQQLHHQQLQQHAFSTLGHGRAPSRMAFSDVGGPSSRKASGSGTVFSHLMHSPTLTTSTSAGSRDGKAERDTHSRSASTAPTSVSSASMAYLRDRDEIQEMKERHATETGALLGALSDSQRTTRMLREENTDLRERLERVGDLEAVNDDLRSQVRSLRREVGEMKHKLQVLSASRAPGSSSRSGFSTPIPDVVLPLQPPPEAASSNNAPPEPETPKHHRRCPSDSSSIFPVLPSNMTMLMHDEDHMHEQLLNGDVDQGDSATLARNGPRPVSFRKPMAANSPPATAGGSIGRSIGTSIVNTGRRSAASISPTTANFSIVTGSPGSLFLRPEHEVHLGDLDTFSLDFGRVDVDDQDTMTGQSGLDDW